MQAVEQAITGARYSSHIGGSTPEAALEQFYAAFNGRDLALMADNWAQTDEIALDNPLGGIRRGWTEIRPLYERVFSGPAAVYVEFYDYSLHLGQELFYAVGRERGYFRRGNTELALAIRTSRVFRQFAGRWKQVHHHGSIEDPDLLARYQSAVLGKRVHSQGA
ncbi:MAG: nuclear transport factor 2 family protein [Candidatus Thermoplasmatota archaeon]|nr:nuclear transport factor 2 family protein [Candidatus Thermoplasmatota archaeon]